MAMPWWARSGDLTNLVIWSRRLVILCGSSSLFAKDGEEEKHMAIRATIKLAHFTVFIVYFLG